MIKLEDLDQSHDWDSGSDVGPYPHSSGYRCRVCEISVCEFCSPIENTDYEATSQPCPGVPWYEVADASNRAR